MRSGLSFDVESLDHDAVGGNCVACQFEGPATLAEDYDAIAEFAQFDFVGRAHKQRCATVCGLNKELVQVGLRGDIDTLRGLVEQQHLGLQPQPLPHNNLLLVSARQGRNTGFCRVGLDAKRPDPSVCFGTFAAGMDTATGQATAGRQVTGFVERTGS